MTDTNSQGARGWPGDAIGPIHFADGLGWASVALGAPMLASPRRLLRAIGIRPDAKATATIAAVGLREFTAAATILGMRHRRVGAWSRASGDLIDLTLLGAAWRTRRQDSLRLLGAIGFVAAVFGTDLLVAVRLDRAEGTHVEDGSGSHGAGAVDDAGGGPARVRTAITIQGSEQDVRAAFHEFAWSAFDPAQLEQRGEVRFVAAPGERGVEVHVDHDPSVPAGSVGAAALKLAGRSPDQRINDELRRFKARFETGVEVRSDKTPEGVSARRQIFQRPGQPVGVSG